MKQGERLTPDYAGNLRTLDGLLRINESFDIVGREFTTGSRRAKLYFIDGFAKDEVMEKILEYLMGLSPGDTEPAEDASQYCERFITYVEADLSDQCGDIVTDVYKRQGVKSAWRGWWTASTKI